MRAYVDATVLIALGRVDALGLLEHVPAEPVVLPSVAAEVEQEPEAGNVRAFRDSTPVVTDPPDDASLERARELLDEPETNGDVAVLAGTIHDEEAVVLSDDRAVRATAEGLGATVSGTLGVLVYAVEDGVSPDRARGLLGRIDNNGFHLTGSLRAQVEQLIEEAAEGE